mmetsp:Transcript_21495/g.66621  ORF Transcript_21495/g.66621 Transcript_21495/m.66621 type:complete len:229 (-) Transcript_21495:84-770(-)
MVTRPTPWRGVTRPSKRGAPKSSSSHGRSASWAVAAAAGRQRCSVSSGPWVSRSSISRPSPATRAASSATLGRGRNRPRRTSGTWWLWSGPCWTPSGSSSWRTRMPASATSACPPRCTTTCARPSSWCSWTCLSTCASSGCCRCTAGTARRPWERRSAPSRSRWAPSGHRSCCSRWPLATCGRSARWPCATTTGATPTTSRRTAAASAWLAWPWTRWTPPRPRDRCWP